MQLAQRLNHIQASGIRKVFELATAGKGEYLNLAIGQPDFPVPLELKQALQRAVDAEANTYTPTLGRLDLRQKIADKLRAENNIPAAAENIIVTSGVSGALFLLFNACFDAGDEVIVPDPAFVLYQQVFAMLGVKMRRWDTYPDFHLDARQLANLITPRTKAILLNTPNNPSGMVYSREELTAVVAVAKQHGLLLIADEIYECFDYDQRFFSIGSIYPNTVTLNGFSKSHAITGWRLGYAHGPQPIIAAMNTLQQYTFVCAPSTAQAAVCAAFEVGPGLDVNAVYGAKRDYVYESLRAKYELKRPEGAFYAYIRSPLGRENFCEELIEKKLLVVPSSVFSARADYFRLSFAVDDQSLQAAVAILLQVA